MTIPDLCQDILDTDWLIEKIRENKVYAQNLYAAFCSNDLIKEDQVWRRSWRGSAGEVAALRNIGEDYLDWYCSGMIRYAFYEHDEDYELLDGAEFYKPEGVITDEVREDLKRIGWSIVKGE